MATLVNHTKEKLAQGKISIGCGLRMARTVDVGRMLKTAGWDWAFIDMEHNSMGIDTAVQIAVACQDTGVTPLVRVPGYEHYLASRVLDAGAMGIVFPHVDTAEQAKRLVSYCKYPPLGHRSVAGTMAQLNFQDVPYPEATDTVNANTLVVMMIESPQAVENADAMAAVPGVDVLLVGSNDLMMEMGIPRQPGDPKLEAALDKVIAACRKHGKIAGLGGVYDEVHAPKFIKKGMPFVLGGSDATYFMAGAASRAKFLHGLNG